MKANVLFTLIFTAHKGEFGTVGKDKLIYYATYLKSCFTLSSTSSSHSRWPPPVTDKIFRLAMIKKEQVQRGKVEDEFIRKTITGKVDDILQYKVPIKLEDIFKNTKGKRKKLLIEGAPGCGKSTLSLDICRQWADGILFQQFQLVILMRLREPVVQNADSIVSILPQRDVDMARDIAQKITACDGSDVLFVLDGWDEFRPTAPNHSVIHSLIFDEQMLHKSSIIITSRPTSSASLHPIVTSRIEVLGFTRSELRLYFAKCLQKDTNAADTLLQRIQENPAVESSCYLPLNASILVHLFKCEGNSLPKTRYGIFSALILNCVYRHLKERTNHEILSIQSLDDLPQAVQDPFRKLCELAYQGVMDNKIIFDLPPDCNTLGLLQGVESFVKCGKSHSYNFLHLSIQELLAAYHIATELEESDQIMKFKELFGQDRFSAVFQFYAAKTKLQTPGITEVLIQVAERGAVKAPQTKDKVHLLSLLNCLFETQDSSLCRFVADHVQSKLDLSSSSLGPVDCLSISYFLVCAAVFDVDLSSCYMGAEGCKTLLKADEVYSNILFLRYTVTCMTAQHNL